MVRRPRRRRGAAVCATALLVGVVAGCAPGGDISIANDSGERVTVRLGSEDIGEVTPHGGVVLLDVTECYEGDVTVTYADGAVVRLDGPLCPGQTLAIHEGRALIRGEAGTG